MNDILWWEWNYLPGTTGGKHFLFPRTNFFFFLFFFFFHLSHFFHLLILQIFSLPVLLNFLHLTKYLNKQARQLLSFPLYIYPFTTDHYGFPDWRPWMLQL